MNLNKVALAAPVACMLAVAACGTSKQQQGNFVGAIAGGVLGSQVGSGSARVAATIAGSLLGGYAGGQIGRQMDEQDRARAGQALETTPTNQVSAWENPDTGHSYSITPTRTYQQDAQPCRDYTTEAVIDGQKETVSGTACRQADGTWRAAN